MSATDRAPYRPSPGTLDGLVAAAWAGVLSGIPSTLHALLFTGAPLEATAAAGSMLLPREARIGPLLMAAVPVHGILSLGWALVLERVLPRRRTVAAGASAGLAIAVLDLGVAAWRFPRIRSLPRIPQVVDHLAFGVTVALVIRRRRERR